MTIAHNIQIFLQKKLEETNLDRKDFAQESGIFYDTVNKIINAKRLNPDLSTLLKIAKYFQCTIDEVIQRTDYYVISHNNRFNDISLERALLNLKDFINTKLTEKNLTLSKLSSELGFSEDTIAAFINGKNKSLGSAVILALADYSEVSIDKIIGRVSTLNHELQALEKVEPKTE